MLEHSPSQRKVSIIKSSTQNLSLNAKIIYDKNWMLQEDIVCTRDDKTKRMAFIKRHTYENLLESFIQDSASEHLPKDTTDDLHKKVQQLIRASIFPTVGNVEYTFTSPTQAFWLCKKS